MIFSWRMSLTRIAQEDPGLWIVVGGVRGPRIINLTPIKGGGNSTFTPRQPPKESLFEHRKLHDFEKNKGAFQHRRHTGMLRSGDSKTLVKTMWFSETRVAQNCASCLQIIFSGEGAAPVTTFDKDDNNVIGRSAFLMQRRLKCLNFGDLGPFAHRTLHPCAPIPRMNLAQTAASSS